MSELDVAKVQVVNGTAGKAAVVTMSNGDLYAWNIHTPYAGRWIFHTPEAGPFSVELDDEAVPHGVRTMATLALEAA